MSVLSTLIEYEALRANATNIFRPEGSNVDVVSDESGNEVVLCHMTGILPFHWNNQEPWVLGFEDTASLALAAHQLNTGDGSIVPQVAGLDKRCKVRFTMESADTELLGGKALRQVNKLTGRDPTGDLPLPCAFVGAYRSAVSISTSIILGTLGYPQVSPGSVSDELDDKSQYPLFSRTLPSNEGNAFPFILYLRDVLRLSHLAVISVSDSFGNGYVEALRKAAANHSPNLNIHHISLDFEDGSIENAISNLRETNFRFVLVAVYSRETHDALLAEAYKQGVAGTGLHNWLYAATFFGTLDGRVLEKGSPLHYAYRGAGYIQVSGGFPGIPTYDNYLDKMRELKNPADLQYLESKFPEYETDSFPKRSEDPDYIDTITNGYNPFAYEAAIGLGLSACEALTSDNILTGEEHTRALRNMVFEGISGNDVVFDTETGTRDPSSALYKVTNYVEVEQDGGVVFQPIITSLFQNSEWVTMDDYIYNDGTSRLPVDIAPAKTSDGWMNLTLIVGVPVVLIVVFGLLYLLIREHKRKSNDLVWLVKKEEIKFDEPPVILGQGTFGIVLKGQFRGTSVGVKRVVTPTERRKPPTSDVTIDWVNRRPSNSNFAGLDIDGPGTRSVSISGVNSLAQLVLHTANGVPEESPDEGSPGRTSPGTSKNAKRELQMYRKMKRELVEEMRYLSRLRHPCVTTIMGAVLEWGNDPMIILEFMEHGSLFDLLHNQTVVIEGEMILTILRDISQGMRFLHASKILHGDLKAANVLVDSRYRAKVADFGLSQRKEVGGTGTPYWMAPELLRFESPNTRKSDVFSFGVILYEVYAREHPYPGESAPEVMRGILDTFIKKRVTAPDSIPSPIKLLKEDCLQEFPEQRPTFEEIDVRLRRINAESATPLENTSGSERPTMERFPKHMAEAVHDGRKVDAEHKDMVTILFSEIVGRYRMQAELGPEKATDLLDRLHRRFDELCDQHGVFRLETTGTGYMAVANLVETQDDDHCKRIARLATDMAKAASQTLVDSDQPSSGYVTVHVGFHAGPVVADLIGHRNPQLALFGDTVNTASRVGRYSESSVNRITCSEGTAQILVKQWPEVSLVDRGEVSVRGKGMMRCCNIRVPGDANKLVVPESAQSTDGDWRERSNTVEEKVEEPEVENGFVDLEKNSDDPDLES